MQDNAYFKPGIAAIVLALLFPVYWVYIFSAGVGDFEAAFERDMTSLSWSDLLFVIIGALEVYIYLSLKRLFANLLDSKAISVCVTFMALLVALFHATVLFDLGLALGKDAMHATTLEAIIKFSLAIALVVLVLFSVTGFLFSVFLVVQGKESGTLLKVFAIVFMVSCLLQLTVIFAAVNLIMFPVALLMLAVYFLKEPQTVEVV